MIDIITQATVLNENCGTCKHCEFVELMAYMYEGVLYCNYYHTALWGIDWVTIEDNHMENLRPGNAVCPKFEMVTND